MDSYTRYLDWKTDDANFLQLDLYICNKCADINTILLMKRPTVYIKAPCLCCITLLALENASCYVSTCYVSTCYVCQFSPVRSINFSKKKNPRGFFDMKIDISLWKAYKNAMG